MSTVSLKLLAKKKIIKTEKRDDFESLIIPPPLSRLKLKRKNKTIKPTHSKTKKIFITQSYTYF